MLDKEASDGVVEGVELTASDARFEAWLVVTEVGPGSSRARVLRSPRRVAVGDLATTVQPGGIR